MWIYSHSLLRGSASLVVAAIMLAGAPALGQQSDDATGYNLSIGAKPVLAALADFTAATGIQVVRPGGATIEGRSAAVEGTLSAEAAIAQLLSGTDLSWRFVNRRTIALYIAGEAVPVEASNDGSTVLKPIIVEGDQAWGPVEGLVATMSGAATNTNRQ